MKKIGLIALFLALIFKSYSQIYTDAQIKTAFIYNFALNIEWANEQSLKKFTIAVYGNDSAIVKQLTNLGNSKTIKNLPVEIYNSNDIQSILQHNPQLIYLPADYKDQIKSVYYEILSMPILLVSDDASQTLYVMLNFKTEVVTKKITFELNTKNVEDQHLKILPHLLMLGGSELDQKMLYKLKEDELAKEKEIVKQQQEQLLKQQQVIDSQLLSIKKQEDLIKINKKSVDSLMKQIKVQQDRLFSQNQYLEKLQLAVKQQQNVLSRKVQEMRIQQDSIERQKTLIVSQREQIREKLSKLDNLNTEITNRQKQLDSQKQQMNQLQGKLKIQEIFMILMLLIIALVVFIVIVIFRNYKQKKDLNDKLVQKNHEVEQQSEELQQINQELIVQRDQIQRQNEYITDSIAYAKKILIALLPNLNTLNNYFEHFLVYKPKDIVSGDFYWYAEFNEYKFVAIVDCTGHGVPGALLSILGSRLLTEIVVDKEIYETDKILTFLNFAVQKILKQKNEKIANAENSNDGMDVAICRFEKTDQKLNVEFSGAKRPLFYYDSEKKELSRISGSRKGIGGMFNEKLDFEKVNFVLNSGDLIYLTTDGIIDQNNPLRKRLGTPQFMDILKENVTSDIEEQKNKLELSLRKWQDSEPQRDDITILALKVK